MGDFWALYFLKIILGFVENNSQLTMFLSSIGLVAWALYVMLKILKI